jgi:rare lipoprotein A
VNAKRLVVRACGLLLLGLAGCATTRHPNVVIAPAEPEASPPPVVSTTPQSSELVPRVEPRSKSGNPPYYDVYGKRYYVLSSSVAYVERGVASWYGPGFDRVKTSSGETYDMHAMSAAHCTLPLPAYVRVTNLQNGRSVVVRVNDRGPFVGNRLIDLSYAAAARLDMLHNGTAMVEVRALDPNQQAQASPVLAGATPANPAAVQDSMSGAAPTAAPAAAPPPVPRAPLFVQAGAFSDPANAERLAAKLRGSAYGKIFVRDDVIAGRKMYRVRIGPVPNVPEFDRIVAALGRAGVHDAHLALE